MRRLRRAPWVGAGVLTAALLVLPRAAWAQEDPEGLLPRRPFLVQWVRPAEGPGVRIGGLGPGSAADRAGLAEGDVIRRVNGAELEGMGAWLSTITTIEAGDTLRLEATRDGETYTATVAVPAFPLEEHPGVEVTLGSVTVPEGYRVRTIRTAPEGAHGRLPAVFLAPWLSCDSVENPFGAGGDGMMRLLHRLARMPGWVTWRVERPGVGDSEGPDCGSLGFEDELEAYRAGFRAMIQDPRVDPESVFILGLSNGGGFAPLVPEGHPVAGYLSVGGWGRTWLEHMLDHERLRMGRLEDMAPEEVNEVLHRDAELPPKYGRSGRFHRQLQELNLEAAWAAVEAPALIVRGEHDWIMSAADVEAIVNAAEQSRDVSFLEVPGMDHFLMVHPSMESSYGGSAGTYAQELEDAVASWLEEHAAPPG